MRIRKRAAAVAVLGVIAVAITGAVAVARDLRQGPAEPVTAKPYHVTVNTPRPGSPGRLIASGSLDGRRWQATGWRYPGRGVCFETWGSALSCDGVPGTAAPREAATCDPVTIALSEGAPPTFIARVRADVAYLIVTLTNGQRLTLRPVAIFGPGYARYVAFPVPASSAVVMITAFSARAEVGYAIPFTGADGLDTVLWRRSGEQPPSKRASYLIGSGTLNGRPWSEHAYQGPWGFCVVTPLSATWCIPDTPGNLTAGKAATLLFQSWAGDTGYVTVAATPAVSYLVLSHPDGSTARITPRVLFGEKFFVFGSSPPAAVRAWAAYSATGARLAAGAVP